MDARLWSLGKVMRKKIEYLYEVITSLTWLRVIWTLWMCFAMPGQFIYERSLWIWGKITGRKDPYSVREGVDLYAYELAAIVVVSTLFYAGLAMVGWKVIA